MLDSTQIRAAAAAQAVLRYTVASAFMVISSLLSSSALCTMQIAFLGVVLY
jgi:hypothetical protein